MFLCWSRFFFLSMRNAWTRFVNFTLIYFTRTPPVAFFFLPDNLWTLPPRFELCLGRTRSHAQSKQQLHSAVPALTAGGLFESEMHAERLFVTTSPFTFFIAVGNVLLSNNDNHKPGIRHQRSVKLIKPSVSSYFKCCSTASFFLDNIYW